jgi:hypothetical protein
MSMPITFGIRNNRNEVKNSHIQVASVKNAEFTQRPYSVDNYTFLTNTALVDESPSLVLEFVDEKKQKQLMYLKTQEPVTTIRKNSDVFINGRAAKVLNVDNNKPAEKIDLVLPVGVNAGKIVGIEWSTAYSYRNFDISAGILRPHLKLQDIETSHIAIVAFESSNAYRPGVSADHVILDGRPMKIIGGSNEGIK